MLTMTDATFTGPPQRVVEEIRKRVCDQKKAILESKPAAATLTVAQRTRMENNWMATAERRTSLAHETVSVMEPLSPAPVFVIEEIRKAESGDSS